MKRFIVILLLFLIYGCTPQYNIVKEGPEFPISSSPEAENQKADASELKELIEELPDSLIRATYDKKLLIFVSPQYSQDEDIINSIKIYQKAAEEDIKWGSEIILLSHGTNSVGKIRERIKTEYNKHPIKAAIMVGEDTRTMLNVETADRKEVPSVFLWSDLNEELKYSSYTISPSMNATRIDSILKNPGSTIAKPSVPEVAVSLLYPSESGYREKKEKIISAFNKFSNRQNSNGTRIKLIQFDYTKDTEGNQIKGTAGPAPPFVKALQNLEIELLFDCSMCNLALGENCTICNFRLEQEYKMYVINAHGSPDKLQVSSKGYFFTTKDLERLKSPFFAAFGCHATGWYTSMPPNKRLDTAEGDSFSQYVFTNPHLRVFMGGGTSYNNDEFISFFNKLNSGLTMAEAFIGSQKTLDGSIIYGDPTFHY